jgi:diadenosine tetraphosphate (Ap4A) HIT family hydrolase
MFDKSCIFCKIVQKEISGKLIKENEHVLVIEDIVPKAPIHYLIIPKKHVVNLGQAQDIDLVYGFEMMKIARELGGMLQPPAAFNLISNHGAAAGQSVFHWHCHFIAGRNIYENGFDL